MEFESPDVQKDFPGLYASESGRRSNESDYSDDGHEKLSKKDLLIGKRKDKKDSKKDRGYAALEGESSPEEDPEIKSPSKSKKSKSFKFPSKKEKREKSRDKDIKEKDKELEKKKEKEAKAKLKLKERKKSKHGDDSFDIAEELPIFGVSLELAVQRSRCHDGVDIPLIVRDCIDYVEEQCMNMENIYKLSGIKSKVQTLKRLYNQRDTVRLIDYEPPVITSLIKLFLRELPESILTHELSARFEEAAATKEVRTRESELNTLVNQLPRYNKQLLAWLMIHLDNLTSYEKLNKMNAQNVAIELSPILQMSHRLLAALLCHCRSLFPNIIIKKYIPPLTAGVGMPENETSIHKELAKQESLLSQIHMEMNAGLVSKSKEEQLWEVQRIITQLKRKLRTVQREREMNQAQKSLEEDKIHTQSSSLDDEFRLDLTLQKALSEEDGSVAVVAQPPPAKVSPSSPEIPKKSVDTVDMPIPVVNSNIQIPERSPILEEEILPSTSKQEEDFTDTSHIGSSNIRAGIVIDTPEEWQGLLQEEAALQLEHRELLCLQADLQGRVQEERNEIERLRTELATARAKCNYRSLEEDSSEGSSSSHSDISESEDDPVRKASILELKRENQMLQEKKSDLVRRIMQEREACLHLRVQLSLLQLSQESKQL